MDSPNRKIIIRGPLPVFNHWCEPPSHLFVSAFLASTASRNFDAILRLCSLSGKLRLFYQLLMNTQIVSGLQKKLAQSFPLCSFFFFYFFTEMKLICKRVTSVVLHVCRDLVLWRPDCWVSRRKLTVEALLKICLQVCANLIHADLLADRLH